MKKIFLSISIPALIIGFAACTKKSTAPSNSARMMFVNGCAGAAAIDAAANNVKITGATNIGFLKNTGYLFVTAGSNIDLAYSINASGLITPLINSAVTINPNLTYSVYAGGIFTKPNFIIATDDMTVPPVGSFKVRFVNLSSDTLNENCFIGSQKIDSNVGYKTITPFIQIPVPTTSTTVLLQDPAYPTKIAQLSSQSFSSGKIYTVILSGTSTASTGTSSILTLTIINNN